MRVTIGSYGEYSSNNYGVNTMCVGVGNMILYFSYRTVVAVNIPGKGFYICENKWGPTTGKHLNWIDGGDKEGRMSYDDFQKLLSSIDVEIDVKL